MRQKASKEHMRAIGKKGGRSTARKRGHDYMKELGRKGGKKSWVKRKGK